MGAKVHGDRREPPASLYNPPSHAVEEAAQPLPKAQRP
jgi:hypothetical protein